MNVLLDYYDLKVQPFNITSDPEFLFESKPHREALASLLYGINERKGIILITGEVGTGKTTLCKALLSKLPSEIKTSLILDPYFSQSQLLQAIMEDFGLHVEKTNRLDMVKSLKTYLAHHTQEGGNAVVILDEAQDFTSRQLEQIRLLTNLELAQKKLLQVVLVGQPELSQKVRQHNLRQIYQRIVVKYNLEALEEADVKDYVDFRLQKAGTSNITLTPEAYCVIYEFSKGIPRLINILCERALLLGFVKKERVFDEKIFNYCVEEVR